MNIVKTRRRSREVTAILATAGLCLVSVTAVAQDVQHLSITQPGGMPGLPVMTGVEKISNGVSVTWDGPSGYYQLLQKSGLTKGSWQPVGGPNLNRQATITKINSSAFFRVSGPSPQYVGAQACIECHENIHTTEMNTRHAKALETLKKVNADKNPSCLPCHTVGYGLPTGFNEKKPNTMHLAGVQCESCHGPSGNHAANEFDFTVRPRADIAATVCGGCHTGSQHPTYDEWTTSNHATVTRENMDANSCGRCHIGSARLALMNNETPPQNDRNIGVVCVTCHDPHGRHVFKNVLTGVVYTNQLRNPVTSTDDYFLTTSDVFTSKYNPNINICAQCHNHRGATWTANNSAPHPSPQYNMLLGTVGLLPAGFSPRDGVHAGIRSITNSMKQVVRVTNQCVTCHMQTKEFQSGPPETAAMTGHSFNVDSYDACRDCHGDQAAGLVYFTQEFVFKPWIQLVKSNLDLWATTKAPAVLRTNYGVLAWEYTNPGALSVGTPGPNASQQTNSIPENIRKARFNLYMVFSDGSYGVHNSPYSYSLLTNALSWVEQELSK